jgi:hypothetical protein
MSHHTRSLAKHIADTEELARRYPDNPQYRAVTPEPVGDSFTSTDVKMLHLAIVAETYKETAYGKGGPRTFLRELGEIVATHLQTRDVVLVKAAIERLMAAGLVRPMAEDDDWNPRGMWWVETRTEGDPTNG